MQVELDGGSSTLIVSLGLEVDVDERTGRHVRLGRALSLWYAQSKPALNGTTCTLAVRANPLKPTCSQRVDVGGMM